MMFSAIGISGELLFYLGGTYSQGDFFYLSSDPVTLYFTSDALVTYPGFRVEYYVGEGSPGKRYTDRHTYQI